MEQVSTRRFFSSEFVIKNKLSFSTVIILQDVYFWILSNNPPKKIILNHKTFYFISQSHFTRFNNGLLSQPAISKIFNQLKEIGIIESSFVKDEKENYINFNWNKIKESLLPDEELQIMEDSPWWKRIHAYADEQIRQEHAGNTETIYDTNYEIVKKGNRNCLVKKEKEQPSKSYNNSEEKKEVLFEMEDKSPKYSIEAYSIAKKLIEKSKKENREYFKHKYNEYGEEQTKLITKSCQFIQAIYNGNFLNPRQYSLSEKFMENQQFPIELPKVKEILNEVKGDWKQVKKLILNAYENFELMHQENYCPCNKQFLNKSLSDWFYGYCDEAGKYQSQFIQCLFEIPLTKKFYSEKKADRIFEGLSSKSCEYGEQLIDLNPSMNSGTAWENIKKMIEWAKLVIISEQNAGYWISNPSEIIKKFVEWAKINNVQISTNSFDINWCIENNGPWVWFVQNAIKEYKFNSQLINLVDEGDFLDCYKPSSGISFDDMQEVIF